MKNEFKQHEKKLQRKFQPKKGTKRGGIVTEENKKKQIMSPNYSDIAEKGVFFVS